MGRILTFMVLACAAVTPAFEDRHWVEAVVFVVTFGFDLRGPTR